MLFPQRVRLLFGSSSPSKFGDEISSFADLGCLSRILNPESECFPSRIQDTGSKFFPSWIPDPRFEFFPSQVLDPGCISKNLSILTKKMVSQLSEIWSRFSIPDPDPGSESWLFTYPRSRIQGSKRQRIPDPGSRIEKIQIRDQGSRMQKILIQDPGSGMEKIRIWDPRSGINIPDQQNWKSRRQIC